MPNMSLEAALDEERREIMALLEGKRTAPRSASTSGPPRSGSPAGMAMSPVRSMLDIGDDVPRTTRHASIAGLGVGVTSPTSPRFPATSTVRSMLDTTAPASSSPLSPGRTSASPPAHTRSNATSPKLNPEDAYQFEMLPSIDSHALPKRVTQGGKKDKSLGGMASVLGGRHHSTAGLLGKHKSQSPSSRASGQGRSASPGGRKLNSNSLNLMPDPGKYVSESGKVIDMQNAYRRLSDAALLKSGGNLSKLAMRKGSDPLKGESLAPGGGVRLQKDYYGDEDEEAVESSDDSGGSSHEDESDRERGRRRARKGSNASPARSDSDANPGLGVLGALDSLSGSSGGGNRKPKSLLAAAEEERKQAAAQPMRYRSLLAPDVSVTGPDGAPLTKKSGKSIHPNTSFDSGSGRSTPALIDSDTEADMSEIRRAQKLAMNISPIHSTPSAHRCIRQIVRGEYATFLKEAEMGLRRQRVYLVATDLSEEAAYALEWTIGTVLRDGDTLLAVYAVDEEAGTGGEAGSVGVGEGAKAMHDATKLVKTLSNEPAKGSSSMLSPLQNEIRVDEKPDFERMSKAERERWHAAEEVGDRCVKLLRKTRLQVRVIVEVFHCKSPKHMITEVIDYLEPTLVVLGSRGRNAIKGVLLGSFSNYLVTKSSVPVMVARKRLRKHSKYKRANMRMSNVLSTPNSRLASAKID